MTPSELAELRHERAAAYHEMQRVLGEAGESRQLNADQQRTYDDAQRRFDALTDQIELAEAEAEAARWAPGVEETLRWVDGTPYRPAATRQSGPFLGERRFAQAFGLDERDAAEFSIGAMLQMMAGTRQLPEDSAEARAVITGASGSAGTLVPAAVAAAVLDGVVPASVAHQAGAVAVPMPARSLTLPRVASLPSPDYHAEGQADVPDSPPGFDAAVLEAKTLAVRFNAAVELLEDASAEAANALQQVLVQAIASKVDAEALLGDGASGHATGLYNDADVAHTDLAAGLTKYQDLVSAIFSVRGRNLKPNAAITSEREAEFYAGLEDSTGQPLNAPAIVAELNRLSTTAVPTNAGTGTNESFIAVGDFTKLAIGYRPQVGVRVDVSPLKGESLTREFVAFIRFDVAVLQPAAFQIVDAIVPAA